MTAPYPFKERKMSAQQQLDGFTPGREFGIAACEVIGLDADRVTATEVLPGLAEVFALRFTVAVSVHDLELIDKRMKANKERAQ